MEANEYGRAERKSDLVSMIKYQINDVKWRISYQESQRNGDRVEFLSGELDILNEALNLIKKLEA